MLAWMAEREAMLACMVEPAHCPRCPWTAEPAGRGPEALARAQAAFPAHMTVKHWLSPEAAREIGSWWAMHRPAVWEGS